MATLEPSFEELSLREQLREARHSPKSTADKQTEKKIDLTNVAPLQHSTSRCHGKDQRDQLDNNGYHLGTSSFGIGNTSLEELSSLRFPKVENRASYQKIFSELSGNVPRQTIESESKARSPLLKNFPTAVDGAGNVEDLISPTNPAMRIVHIRQSHVMTIEQARLLLLNGGAKEGPELEVVAKAFVHCSEEAAEKSQQDIKKIEIDLIKNHNINDIYQEGYCRESEADPNVSRIIKNIEGHRQLAKQLINLNTELLSGSEKDERGKFEKRIADLTRQVAALDQTQKILGATGELHQEGILPTIRPLERSVENKKQTSLIGKPGYDEVGESREDIGIIIAEKVERSDDGVAIFVMGANHDWSNNIEAYNRLFPEKQIALTVITPNANQDDERLKKEWREKIESIPEYKLLFNK